MPIYEYTCTCGERFEELVLRTADEADVACRRCGSREVRREMSRPSAPPSGSRSVTRARDCGPVG